ncbi:MAG TPA: helicase-related protein, partial [Candidatus Eisenbacteria bacterium]|nr:helicase-related protein [Candidatus Eisenbacteria bacterium]
DVEGITHVINYDVPHAPEDYVHRIGRTGRVDAVGDAFTLIAPEEQKQLSAIERFLGRAVPRVILPDFDYKRRPSEKRPSSNHGAARHTGSGGSHGRGRPHASSGHSGRGHAPSGGSGRAHAPSGGSGRGQGPSGHSNQSPPNGSTRPSAEHHDVQQHGRRPRKSTGLDRRGRRRI